MQVVKGMIQIEGATYRIARVLPHIYEAVRILDNQVAGWFTSDLSVIAPHAVDLFTLRTVAQEAVTGVFETLKVLEKFEVEPFRDGYEGSPYNDFVGRLDDWNWPEA